MSQGKVKPEKVKVKKPARKRDARWLVPETLFARVINFSVAGLLHFHQAPITYNDALRWHLAHPKAEKKAFKKRFSLTSRGANTIIRQVRGMRKSIAENVENRIEATEAHIAKAKVKLKKLAAVGRRTGSLKDKIQRLTEKLTCQKKQRKNPSIFFGRDEYQHQPVALDYSSPAEFSLAYAKFRREYETARYGQFGCIGSHDEEYGNRTYQLRSDCAVKVGSYFQVPLWHSREQQADLRFTEEEYNQLMAYQATKEAITVKFTRNRNHWIAHISLMCDAAEQYTPSAYVLGTDVNADKLSWVLFKLDSGKLTIARYGDLPIPDGSTAKRESALRKAMRILTGMAKTYGAIMSFENLDLRKTKAKDNGAGMNAVLHGLPYAKVMELSSRMCLKQGIPFRYVNPAFTSLAGGLFTALYPQLDRDQGACLPIGLLATDAGRKHLNTLSRKLLTEGGQYRTSVKGAMNLTVDLKPRVVTTATGTNGSSVGGGVRRSTAHSRTDLEDFYLLGRQLSGMTKTLYQQLAPKSQRSRVKPDCECHWSVTAQVKSLGGDRVVRELAAGSLNVLNPANVWLRNTPVATGVFASAQL